MSFLDRFKTDELPDATWGICKVHSPSAVVRLVGDDGRPAKGGICQFCYEEAHDAAFFPCPIHGINPKVAGRPGCPVDGCLGESLGPTEEEIERETLAISRVWPGGPPKGQDALAASPARFEDLGDGEVGERARTETRDVPVDDPVRAGEPAASAEAVDYERLVDPQGVPVQPEGRPPPPPRLLDPAGRWIDPFLVEE